MKVLYALIKMRKYSFTYYHKTLNIHKQKKKQKKKKKKKNEACVPCCTLR
jgi:hypothetical protein